MHAVASVKKSSLIADPEHRCAKFYQHMLLIRSTQTAEQYFYAVERFLCWLDRKGLELATAPQNALASYCAELFGDGYVPATVTVQLAAVNRYVRWVELAGGKVPKFHAPETPRTVRRVRDVLDPEALKRYVEAADGLHEPLRTAAKLLPSSGLRSGEAVVLGLSCLRMTELELADGTKTKAYSVRVRGKGGHERVVPLLDEGVEVLREYKSWRRTHGDKRWLFPGRQAGHMSPHTLRTAVASLRAPGQEFTPHTFRRTYLTTLYKRGVDPVMLAKIAGHADVRTLMQHYLALDEHDVVSAVQRASGRNLKEERP